MKQIENYINELVLQIKSDEQMCNYTFVKGFGTKEHENPQTQYLIAVSALDTQTGTEFVGGNVGEGYKGCMYNTTVKFRVYAPKTEGGDGLLGLCHILTETIKRCDTNNVCEEIKTSSIAFDSDAMTVYRDVVATLSFCLYEEVTG